MGIFTRLRTFLLLLTIVLLGSLQGFSQVTYTWTGATSTSWAVATNWTPTRTTPAVTDIIVFNTGGTVSVTAIPAQTIRQLLISNNTSVSLAAASISLSINGPASTTNLSVPNGSSLTIGSTLTLAYLTGATQLGDISGTLNVVGAFNAAGVATAVTTVSSTGIINNNGGTVTGSLTALVFANGATYNHNTSAGGSVPTANWAAGSTCVLNPVTNGTTIANLTQTFSNLTINPAGGTTLALATNPTVSGVFNMAQGALNLTTAILTLNGTATGIGTIGTSTAGGGGTLTIGGTEALGTLNFTSGSNPILTININRTGTAPTVDIAGTLNIKTALNLTSGVVTNTTGTGSLVLGNTTNSILVTRSGGSLAIVPTFGLTTGQYNLTYTAALTTGPELPPFSALIPAGTLTINQTVTLGSDGKVFSVAIPNTAAYVLKLAGYNLQVAGNFVNSAVLTTAGLDASVAGSTISYVGTAAQSITSGNQTIGGILTLPNVEISNTFLTTAAPGVSLANALPVNNLIIDAGANLNLATFVVSVKGNLVNDGGIVAAAANTTSGINMNGTLAQTISGVGGYGIPNPITLNGQLQNLTINNTAGVTLSQALTIRTSLTLTAGLFSNGTNLTIGVAGTAVTLNRNDVGAKLASVPTFGYATGAYNIVYAGTLMTCPTDNELPDASIPTNGALSVAGTFNTITLGKSANIGSLATLTNGIFYMGSGGYTLGLSAAIPFASHVGQFYADGASGNTILLNGAAPQTITIGGAVAFNGNIPNLTVNNTGGVVMNNSITVSGVLNLQSANALTMAAAKVLTLNGTITGVGTITSASNTSVLVFGGTGNMGTLNLTASAQTFGSVTVNITGTNPSVTINGSIGFPAYTLTSGIVNMGNNVVTYSAAGTVFVNNPGSFSSYFSFLGSTGGFLWTGAAVAATTYKWPVGPAGLVNGYRPVSITASTTTTSIKIGFINTGTGNYSNTDVPTSGTDVRTNYIANLTTTATIGSPLITMEYQNTDLNSTPGTVQVYYHNGIKWTSPGAATLGTNTPNSTAKSLAIAMTAGGTYPLIIGAPINDPSVSTNTWTWTGGAGTVTWGTASNWSPIGIPPSAATTNIIINNTSVIQPTLTQAAIVNNITVGTGCTLTFGAFALTVSGADVAGVPAFNVLGTVVANAGSVVYNGTGTQTIIPINYFVLTSSSTGARILSPTGIIGLSSTFTPGTNAYTNTGSTVQINATQTLTFNGFHFYNLIVNTGTFTLAASSPTFIDRDLTINTGATFADAAASLISGNTTGTFTINGTGILTMVSTTTTTTALNAGSFPLFANYNFSAASTVNYNGAIAGQPVHAIPGAGYGTLGITTAALTSAKTANGSFAIQGDLKIAATSALIDGGNPRTISVAGNITTTGTLTLSNAGSILNLNGLNAQSYTPGTHTITTVQINSGNTVTLAGALTTTNLTVNTGTLASVAVALTATTTNVTGTLTTTTGTKALGTITINNGGTISSVGAAAFTSTGLNIANGGTWIATTATATIGGDVINNGSFTAGTGLYTLTGALKSIGGSNPLPFAALTISTGTYTNTNAALSITGTFTVTPANGLINNGNITATTLTVSAATGLVNTGAITATTINATLGTGLTNAGTMTVGTLAVAGTVNGVINAGTIYVTTALSGAGAFVNGYAGGTVNTVVIPQTDGTTTGLLYYSPAAVPAITTLTANGTSGSTPNKVIYNGIAAQIVKGTTAYWNLSIGTLSPATAPIATAQTGVSINKDFAIDAGTFADGGFQITGNASGTFSVAGNATYTTTKIATPWMPTLYSSINLNAASTFNYNGATLHSIVATPNGTTTFTAYGILGIGGTTAVAKTLATPISVTGININLGTLADGGFQITGPGTGSGTFYIANLATAIFTMTNTNTSVTAGYNGPMPLFGTYNLSPLSITNYNAAAAGQAIYPVPSPGYGTLTVSLGSVAKVLSDTTYVQGTVTTVLANTLDLNDKVLFIAGATPFANAGTLTANSTNSTIVLNGTVAQVLNMVGTKTGNYISNLIISNTSATGAKVTTTALVSIGNLTTTSTPFGIFDLGAFTLTVLKDIENSGTIISSTAGALINMAGTSQQKIEGSGNWTSPAVGTLLGLTINNTSGATPAVNLNTNLGLQTSLTLTNGALGGSGTFTLGIGATSTLTMTRTLGSLNINTGYNLTGVTFNAIYGGAAIAPISITTGTELPPAINSMTSSFSAVGGAINLASPVSLGTAGILTLTNTVLSLGNNNLTVNNVATGAVAGTFSVTNMIVADAQIGTGQLIRNTSGVVNYTFPIGDATGTTEYSPVLLSFSANTTPRLIGANVTNTQHPDDATTDNYINRYWSFTDSQVGTGTYTYTPTFTFVTADQSTPFTYASVFLDRWDGTNWSQYSNAGPTPTLKSSVAVTSANAPLGGSDFTGRVNEGIYEWTHAVSSDWQVPGNWTPDRDVASANDVLRFDDGATTTATNIPTQTVGKILVSNNTNVTLQGAAASTVLTINGPANTNNLAIASGSNITLGSTTTFNLAFGTTTTQKGDISGSLNVNTNNTFTTTTLVTPGILVTGSITNNGGTITSSAPSLTFGNGSFYNHAMNGGAIPVATYNNSTYTTSTVNITGTTTTNPTGLSTAATGPFSNLIWNPSGTQTATGAISAAITVNGNLSVLAGTLYDAGVQITGNATGTLTVANGATLQIGAAGANTELFPLNFTTPNISLGATSTVIYNTNSNIALSAAPPAYGNLIISGTGIRTANGAVTVNGNLTVNAGTLADGGFQISGPGTGSGTFTLANVATAIFTMTNTNTTISTGYSGSMPLFANYNFGALSTSNYNSAGAGQAIYPIPSPGYGNLTVSLGSVSKVLSSATYVQGTVTTVAGNTLDLNDKTLFIAGAAPIANAGTLTANSTNSTIVLNGSLTQALTSNTGTYTSTLVSNLVIDNPSAAGVTLATATTPSFGNITINSGRLFNLLAQTIKISGLLSNNGTLNASAGGVTLNGGAAQNFDPGTYTSSLIGTFTASNPAGATLMAPVNATTLALTSGTLNTTATNILTVKGTVAASVTTAASAYVNGPLARTLPASSSATTWVFPIGKSAYNLLELISPTTSAAGQLVVTAEVTDAAPTGTNGPAVNISTATRYWSANISGAGAFTSMGTVRITDASVSGKSVAYATALGGIFNTIGGTVSAAPVASSSSPITGSSNYIFTSGDRACLGNGATPTVYTVGPTGQFARIMDVVNVLNVTPICGNLIFELQSNYDGTTGEVFPIAINALTYQPSGNIWNVTFRPGAGVSTRTTSGTPAAANGLFVLNGANNITFDGRPGGVGSTTGWIVRNLQASNSPTFNFISDASGDTIQYVQVEGQNTTATSGTIAFAAGTTNGIDNNVIDHCNIRDRSDATGLSINAIYAAAGSLGKTNDNNKITNNNIFNFWGAGATGIDILNYNTGWTISGNSFYQTAARASTTAGNCYGINIASGTGGDNMTITNNYIGGTAPNAGGTAWTQTSTVNSPLIGISVDIASGGSSTISGNTIANISWACSNNAVTAAPGLFTGIYTMNGSHTIDNNTIGSATGTGSLVLTSNSSGPFSYGISSTSGNGSIIITNNTIGAITIATSAAASSHSFIGIDYAAGLSSATRTVTGNLIGSRTTVNSIITSAATSTTLQKLVGINMASGATAANVSNNTIANLTNQYSGTGAGVTIGINSPTGVNTIVNDTVRNITSAAGYIGAGTTASVIGIYFGGSTTGNNISHNTVHSLTNTNNSVATHIIGIFAATGTASTIDGNNIHSIGLSTSATAATIDGLYLNGGGWTTSNNMISMGYGPDGSSSFGYVISGINDASGTNNHYFNSVYIGGNLAASANNSYALVSAATSGTRFIENNILWNQRTNTSTGKNYAIKVGAVTGLTSDYNDLFANGTNGMIGVVGAGTDQPTLSGWASTTAKDAHSISGDPKFINATGNAAAVDLHINPALPTPIEAAGLAIAGISLDIDGDIRANYTPTDMGADAANLIAVDITPPTITVSVVPAQYSCTGTLSIPITATVTDLNSGVSTTYPPTLWWRISGGTWASVSGTSPSAGNYSYTLNISSVAVSQTYEYYVAAEDNAGNVGYSSSTSTTPVHLHATTSPTTSNASPSTFSTLAIVPLSGTVTVGTGGNYTTLSGAGGLFAAINANGLSGDLNVTVISNTTETGANALNQWAEYCGTGYSLYIRPDGTTLRVLSGTYTGTNGIISFNGADRVYIDGQFNGDGLRHLHFHNTTAGYNNAAGYGTMYFYNDATRDTVKNCIIEGHTKANVSGVLSGGVVMLGTASIDGNSYNTFINNMITGVLTGNGGDASTCLFFAQGSASFPNHDITLLNNDFKDFSIWSSNMADNAFGATNNRCYGLYVTATGNGSNWNIKGNSFYTTFPENHGTFTCLGFMPGSSSTNNSISANYFGGTGTKCGQTGNFGFTGSTYNQASNGLIGYTETRYEGMIINAGNITIDSNTIKKIWIQNRYFSGFACIDIQGTTDAIVTNNTFAGSTLAAYSSSLGTNTDIIEVDGGGGTQGDGYIFGTWNQPGSGNLTFSGNSFGVLLQNGNGSVGGTIQTVNYLGAGTVNITNNVFNWSESYGKGYNSYAIRFDPSASSSGNVISGNVITNQLMDGTVSGARIAGIYCNTGSGISVSGTVANNRIYGLNNNATGGLVDGIYLNTNGYTNNSSSWDVLNNRIYMDNGAGTKAVIMNGINDQTNSLSTNNIMYNSLWLGGSTTVATANNCFALYRFPGGTGTVAGDRCNVRNNIIINTRTAGATSTAFFGAIANQFGSGISQANFTSNNNLLVNSGGTRNNLGIWQTSVYATYALYKAASGNTTEANSYTATYSTGSSNFSTATLNPANLFNDYTTADMKISLADGQSSLFVNARATPITTGLGYLLNVPSDYEGDVRDASTPDIGADEFDNCSAPTFASNTTNQAVCAGSAASFGVSVTGAVTSYQWQVSTDGGATYTNITAAGSNPTYANWTSSSLDLTATTAANNGYRYQVLVTNNCGNITSNAAILTINTAPVVSSYSPLSFNNSICEGTNTGFSVTVTGTRPVTYQWQVSVNGGSSWANVANGSTYSGGTDSALVISNTPIGFNGNQYRVIVMGPCAPSDTSNVGNLTVNGVSVTSQPAASTTVCANSDATISITATNVSTYQWQVSTNSGSSWANLTNTAPYSNATTATLQITAATASMNGYQYRVAMTNICAIPTNSTVSTLTINPTPTDVIVAGGGTYCGATSLTATGGSGGTIYWQNTNSGGTSTATPSSSQLVTATGTYYFRAMSSQGCFSIEGSATVTILPANNPNSTWTGNADNDWFNWQNWSDCVPGPLTDVVIPAARPNYPSTYSVAANPTANSITIDNGAVKGSVTLSGGHTLMVSGNVTNNGLLTVASSGTDTTSIQLGGNWSNSGAFTAGTGSGAVKFIGSDNSTITISQGTSIFNNVTVQKTAGKKVALANDIITNGLLQINTGELEISTGKRVDANRILNNINGTINVQTGSRLHKN